MTMPDVSDTLHSAGGRLTLLDMMAVVGAFGVGFGLGAMLPRGPREQGGAILGAMLVPPVVVVARAVAGRARKLRTGGRLGLFPTRVFLDLILAARATGMGLVLLVPWMIGNLDDRGGCGLAPAGFAPRAATAAYDLA